MIGAKARQPDNVGHMLAPQRQRWMTLACELLPCGPVSSEEKGSNDKVFEGWAKCRPITPGLGTSVAAIFSKVLLQS